MDAVVVVVGGVGAVGSAADLYPYVICGAGAARERGFHYTSLYVDHSIVLYAAQVQLVSAAAALEARVGDLGAARRIFADGAERPSLTRAEQADLLLSWSDIEIRAGRPPKARKLLHRALRAQPTSARVALGLAALDWREGRVRQARAVA